MKEYKYSISIFAYRENVATLSQSLKSAIEAAKKTKEKVIINILINGNRELFQQILKEAEIDKPKNTTVIIYYFSYGDKANTWNQYFYTIKPNAFFHIFIDGYVYLLNETLITIDKNYLNSPFIAASGVPSLGRSAEALKEQMIQFGGIHGNLCIFTDSCIMKFIQNGFKIPLHLYRTDPLIGAVINFNFSPEDNKWNPFNIKVIPELTWLIEEKNKFSIEEITSQYKRRLRQAQGDIENKAIHNLFAIDKIKIGDLPETATELCVDFMKHKKISFIDKIIYPLQSIVVKKLRNTPSNNLSIKLDEFEEVVL